MDIWETLYQRAKAHYAPADVSPFIYAHPAVCAPESESGEIFTGFCIESAGGAMNLCADRAAIPDTRPRSGQTVVRRMIAFRDKPPYGGGSGMSCGACRELLMRLSEKKRGHADHGGFRHARNRRPARASAALVGRRTPRAVRRACAASAFGIDD